MTLPPADKTGKTDKTPAADRSARRRARYAKVLQAAIEAIQEAQKYGPVTAKDLIERHRAGELLWPHEWERINSALSPQPARSSGRPVGSGANRERRIVAAAIDRTFRFRLPAYRNPASPHRLTKSDAIAAAMQRCGLKRVATYEAVAVEMRRQIPIIRQFQLEGDAMRNSLITELVPAQHRAEITALFEALRATDDD